jgi:enediyne biosynthesis protein E4
MRLAVLALIGCDAGDDGGVVDPGVGFHTESRPGAVCADPSLRDAHEFTVLTGPYDESPEEWLRGDGSAVGIADFDGDGLLDVLVLGHVYEEFYLQTPDHMFAPALPDSWRDASIDLSVGHGAAVADYDADGDLDVFVTRYPDDFTEGGEQDAYDVLLQNDGTGRFRDVAPELGLQGPAGHYSTSSTWSDFDNDGDLDLYVSGHGRVDVPGVSAEDYGPGDADRLYVNNGDATFTDMSARIPIAAHESYNFVPLFLDFDGDGWRDLYLANDLGVKQTPCQLVWNREGTFVLDEGAAGLDRAISAMGVGVGDVDEDGGWDLFLTYWGDMELLLSSDAGIWVESSDSVGLTQDPNPPLSQVVGWGDELADLDNDMLLDAIAMFGDSPTTTAGEGGGGNVADQAKGIWIQQPDGTFVQVTEDWEFAETDSTRGFGIADLNEDGWIDVVLPNQQGPSRVYLSNCGTASWLKVELEQPGTMNLDAIGAEIEVVVGDRRLRRPMLAGGTGFGSGLPPVVHFGLADHETVDEVVVHWPDGEVSVVEGVSARQTLTVVREP